MSKTRVKIHVIRIFDDEFDDDRIKNYAKYQLLVFLNDNVKYKRIISGQARTHERVNYFLKLYKILGITPKVNFYTDGNYYTQEIAC